MDKGKRPGRKFFFTTTTLLVTAILTLAPLINTGSAATPSPNPLNWSTNNPYLNSWNYNPQTAITASNVNSLVPQWVFPVPAAPAPFIGAEGSTTTPLIEKGIVYALTNWHRVYALDASNGKILWFKDLPLLKNVTDASSRVFQASGVVGHYHDSDIFYTTNIDAKALLWVFTDDYHSWALDALTGDLVYSFATISPGETAPGKISGNYGLYDTTTPSQVMDEKAGVLVSGSSGNEGTDAGRGFLRGWDVTSNPPKLLWTSFIIPPQNGGDSTWSLKSVQNMSYAWIFSQDHAVDLKSLSSSQLQSVLLNDWGNFAFNGTRSFGGNSPGWGGSWSIDQDTGIAYIATAQPSPYTNATFRPGPNLWSSSILAVDEHTGKFIWGFQTSPHDLWDWDCSWSLMFATVNVNGTPTKMVFKGCKDGFLYALDAATGKLMWFLNPPSITRTACGFGQNGKPLHDPLNSFDMTKNNWPCYPSGKLNAAHPLVVSDPGNTGSIESDPAFDPTTSTVFVATFNHAVTYSVINDGPGTFWIGNRGRSATANYGVDNTTIYAMDASTGQIKWTYFMPQVAYRGGLTVSGGVLYATTADGILHTINAQTGKLIRDILTGGPLIIQPAIGATTNGDYRLILPSSGSFGNFGAVVPGYVIAFGLPAQVAQTTTATATATASVTVVSTQTVPGTSTGIDPTTFYAVGGLAVIFVIATGVLAVRRRKPAS